MKATVCQIYFMFAWTFLTIEVISDIGELEVEGDGEVAQISVSGEQLKDVCADTDGLKYLHNISIRGEHRRVVVHIPQRNLDLGVWEQKTSAQVKGIHTFKTLGNRRN